MRILTEEQIHEFARDRAIDLARMVLELEEAALNGIYPWDSPFDDDPAFELSSFEAGLLAKPHAEALKRFRPVMNWLCSPEAAYGFRRPD